VPVGDPDFIHRPPTEHHIQLGEAENERIALIDQSDLYLVCQLGRQSRRQLKAAEPGPEDHYVGAHTNSLALPLSGSGRRSWQPAGPLAGAVIEQSRAQHRVNRGELDRVHPPGDLPVELVNHGNDRAGVLVAIGREGDIELSRVPLVAPGGGISAPLEAIGDLAGGLSRHPKPGAQLADSKRTSAEQPQRGCVAAAVAEIATSGEATRHFCQPALPGQRQQVAERIGIR
jgi:hypothetical protein